MSGSITGEGWERTERTVPPLTCSASGVSVMTSVEIRGDEEEQFDRQVQELFAAGQRIIDKMLVVDPTASPPVWGWILYRETTDAERTACRRTRETPAETNGEWLP